MMIIVVIIIIIKIAIIVMIFSTIITALSPLSMKRLNCLNFQFPFNDGHRPLSHHLKPRFGSYVTTVTGVSWQVTSHRAEILAKFRY